MENSAHITSDSLPAPLEFPLQKISLESLKLYPKEYQFRSNQQDSGEVESHKINGESWNPLLHGSPIYVHKRRDEKGDWEFAVIDGHHRVNFAKRLAAAGKLPSDFKLDAYVLEEEKGVNTETAKLMLAFKDIARGQNDVIETAKVLKEANENPHVRKKFLPSLQMEVGNLNLAVKFSKISERALNMVEKGDVPVEAAKIVIEKVPNDHDKQERVFKIISNKLKQEYPNYTPNSSLSTLISPKSNDNHNQSWLDKMKARSRLSNEVMSR